MPAMQMPRPTDADKERFRGLVPSVEGVVVKPMFGQLSAVVNGNMFAGMYGSAFGVRLDQEALDELAGRPGTGPFLSPERPMKGWITLPAGGSDDEVAALFRRAYEYALTLPPKGARSGKAGTSPKAARSPKA